MIRARFGIRLGGFFPNAGIFVRNIPQKDFDRIDDWVRQGRTLLKLTAFADIASKLVFEDSGKKVK